MISRLRAKIAVHAIRSQATKDELDKMTLDEINALIKITREDLKERAKRGSREKFLEILAKVPDVEPEEFDKL